MAEQIKYVSAAKLGYYDEKIKGYIADADEEVRAGLQTNIDAEATRAKAAESTNALAAENAQKAADAAQGDVDALEILVGTLPEGTTASNVVEYVNVKTAGIATDAALEELQNQLNGVQGEVGTIKGDYLKGADKTELAGLINAEKERAMGVEGGLEDRIETMEAFWEAAQADGTDADVIDTLKEIQEYIATDESGASAMAASIKQNSDDIDALEGKMGVVETKLGTVAEGAQVNVIETVKVNGEALTVADKAVDIIVPTGALADKDKVAEGDLETALATKINGKADQTALDAVVDDIEALQGVDTGFNTRLEAVEAQLGDGENSVSTLIADAKQEAIDAAAGDATTKANKALDDAKAYADAEDAKIELRVDALEAKAHEHANKALLDTYTQTEANLADAVAKKHEHSNLSVLEGITSAKVTAWDGAEQAAKTYADGLNTAMDARMDAVEEWQANMVECDAADIDALFA